MTEFKLAWLNAGSKDPETNAPIAEAFMPMGDDATDESARIPIGKCPMMTALGVSSLPWSPDDSGHAEAIIAEGVGGLPGVVVAAWDTRSHKMCANLQPGDTVLHSTGPTQSAQVQCKEKKRQVVLATTKKNKEQILVVIDGDAENIQFVANGGILEFNKDGEFNVSSPNGAHGLSVTNDGVWIRGEWLLGGQNPNPLLKVMLGPATGSPGGPASVPLVAAPGGSVGF